MTSRRSMGNWRLSDGSIGNKASDLNDDKPALTLSWHCIGTSQNLSGFCTSGELFCFLSSDKRQLDTTDLLKMLACVIPSNQTPLEEGADAELEAYRSHRGSRGNLEELASNPPHSVPINKNDNKINARSRGNSAYFPLSSVEEGQYNSYQRGGVGSDSDPSVHRAARVQGKVFIEDKVPTKKTLRKRFSFIDVQDSKLLYYNLTVLETLVYSSQVRCHTNQQPAELMALRLLTEMGFKDWADIRVKDLLQWQQRMIVFASEAVAGKDILFFDMPTRDLDAPSALAMVTALQRAARGGRLVAITMTSLTFREYAILDKIQLLSAGGSVYFGPAAAAVNYFAALGRTPSPGASITDFLLDLIDDDMWSGGYADAQLAYLESRGMSAALEQLLNASLSSPRCAANIRQRLQERPAGAPGLSAVRESELEGSTAAPVPAAAATSACEEGEEASVEHVVKGPLLGFTYSVERRVSSGGGTPLSSSHSVREDILAGGSPMPQSPGTATAVDTAKGQPSDAARGRQAWSARADAMPYGSIGQAPPPSAASQPRALQPLSLEALGNWLGLSPFSAGAPTPGSAAGITPRSSAPSSRRASGPAVWSPMLTPQSVALPPLAQQQQHSRWLERSYEAIFDDTGADFSSEDALNSCGKACGYAMCLLCTHAAPSCFSCARKMRVKLTKCWSKIRRTHATGDEDADKEEEEEDDDDNDDDDDDDDDVDDDDSEEEKREKNSSAKRSRSDTVSLVLGQFSQCLWRSFAVRLRSSDVVLSSYIYSGGIVMCGLLLLFTNTDNVETKLAYLTVMPYTVVLLSNMWNDQCSKDRANFGFELARRYYKQPVVSILASLVADCSVYHLPPMIMVSSMLYAVVGLNTQGMQPFLLHLCAVSLIAIVACCLARTVFSVLARSPFFASVKSAMATSLIFSLFVLFNGTLANLQELSYSNTAVQYWSFFYWGCNILFWTEISGIEGDEASNLALARQLPHEGTAKCMYVLLGQTVFYVAAMCVSAIATARPNKPKAHSR